MKHLINVLVLLILSGLAFGLAYLQVMSPNAFGILFLPLTIMMVLWGIKLYKDYGGK